MDISVQTDNERTYDIIEDGRDTILIEGLLVAAEIGVLDSEKGRIPLIFILHPVFAVVYCAYPDELIASLAFLHQLGSRASRIQHVIVRRIRQPVALSAQRTFDSGWLARSPPVNIRQLYKTTSK